MADSEDQRRFDLHGVNRSWLGLWIGLLLAIAVAIPWVDAPLHSLALDFKVGLWHTVASEVTQLGAGPGILLALILSVFGGRRVFFRVLTVLLADGLVSTVIKFLIGRGRPYYTDNPWFFHGPTTAGYLTSMPSGHTTVAAALAVVIARFAPRWRWAGWLLVVLVALSRLVLNMHWTSDVLAGVLVGTLVAQGTLTLFDRRRRGASSA